ncbi:MAG TPA: hypothetical protein VHB73_04975 [Alphaproteobacteria bacterium]|nr:hypothetical protein [Alphaproteobacteria bacterium]
MSSSDLHPVLPGEGQYLRSKNREASPFAESIPARRWVHHVAPDDAHSEADPAPHLLPAHQRKKNGTHRD